MKLLSKLLLLAVFTTALSSNSFAQESLYKRLGGYDAIAAVTDDFITRLATNNQLSRFFVGLSDDSKRKVRDHIIEFLCMKTGGPCGYEGRDMKTSHKGLGITESDWTVMAGLFTETLNKFNVSKKERDEVIALVESIKKDIEEKS